MCRTNRPVAAPLSLRLIAKLAGESAIEVY